MFVRRKRLDGALSVLFVVAMGACGTGGGCCSSSQPLPGGKLPVDQTVEGGAQIRVTPAGFTKLTSVAPGLVNSAFGNGFCIGQGSLSFVDYCNTNQGGACGGGHGCKVTLGLHPNSFSVTVNGQKLNLKMGVDVHTSVPISAGILGSCSLNVDGNNLSFDVDITFSIDAPTGELRIAVTHINNINISGLGTSGCGIVSTIINAVGDIISAIENSFLGGILNNVLTPVFNNLVQGFLPNPLGVAGMVDLGALLSGVSPGTEALLEARVVPGGYVNLEGGGMSLGVITGINSDEDPTTRTPDLDSEPSLCVPPLPAPNFGAPPANLPLSSRATFSLLPADAFRGMPEPDADLAMGISETTLDLFGHHMVTSGGMCLGVGTSLVKQLNVGTIGLLVPSLSELGSDDGKDPLLLVTRPQQALDFTIGDNTDASPALQISIPHLEVDVYAFLFERYTRAFTMDLSMNLGINLTFEQQPGMPAKIQPILTGLSSSNVHVNVLNSQFVREDPHDLELVLPTVFDLLTSQLGALPQIAVPSFAGLSLNNLSIAHVTTSQDDFLALYATLGSSAPLRALGQTEPMMQDAVTAMDKTIRPTQPISTAVPKLQRVDVPEVELIRGALRKSATGRLPVITVAAPARDALGRTLEWSWNFDGGLWHPYAQSNINDTLSLSDRAFAWQGKYTLGLKSRVVGDYRTTSAITELPIVLDSVAPRVHTDKLVVGDDTVTIELTDIVAKADDIEYAFVAPGTDSSTVTSWKFGGHASIARDEAEKIAINGEIVVLARDPSGNTAEVLIAPFHGAPGQAGCGCESTRPTSGGVLLVVLVGGVLMLRGRRRIRIPRIPRFVVVGGLWLGASVAVSMQPGCSCNKASDTVCEVNSDCDGFCPFGQQGLCMNNMCSCILTAGRTGPYSDIAAAPDGTAWVSAYSQTFGDLVVAHVNDAGRIPDESWEWVDGVPDVAPSVDMSSIRGGITDAGPDVGMYTSIVVGSDGTPMVSYFDRDNHALMFAAKHGDVWDKHVVDAGGSIDGLATKSGMYTSLTLRADNGHPGIAYLAHVTDATGEHAEVRFVAASTPTPASAADWTQWTVDSAPLPVVDPASPDIYPLPGGLGLFIDSARLPDNAPVVVYYDRANGDLKMAKLNAATGEFDPPVLLDGSNGIDAGWSPSVAVDANGVVSVAYVNATHDDFKYITDAAGAKSELIDDGYRIVGQSPDGLPKPTFDFVGDDAGLIFPGGGSQPMAIYQDATTQELLLASRQTDGTWTHISIAGHTDPWPGAYGFFASGAVSGTDLIMSSWVIDQPTDENWVEVFKRPIVIQ